METCLKGVASRYKPIKDIKSKAMNLLALPQMNPNAEQRIPL